MHATNHFQSQVTKCAFNVAPRLTNKRKVGPRPFKRLPLILSIASMAFPFCIEHAIASTWVVEKFENYQLHPDWVNTRCQNMEKVNQKGLSNFSEKLLCWKKNTTQTFPRKALRKSLHFTIYLDKNFAQLLGKSLQLVIEEFSHPRLAEAYRTDL